MEKKLELVKEALEVVPEALDNLLKVCRTILGATTNTPKVNHLKQLRSSIDDYFQRTPGCCYNCIFGFDANSLSPRPCPNDRAEWYEYGGGH